MKSFDNRPTVGVPRGKWVIHGGVPQGSVLIYYFLFTFMWKKQTHPFWNSADEQNLKILTFKQSHVYSTSGFFYTTKFSQIWCVVFRNNLKKNCFQLLLIFHYFIGVVPTKFIMWSWLCLLIVYELNEIFW